MKRPKAARPHEEAAVELLRSDPETINEYLRAALDGIDEPGGETAFLMALKHVALARGGIAKVASNIGMKREAVSRALSPRGNPTLRTLKTLMQALGLRLDAYVTGERRTKAAVRKAA